MTPFASRNLLRNSILFFVFLFKANIIIAQHADTIIVYEYINVVDTIWVESENENERITHEPLQPINNVNVSTNNCSNNEADEKNSLKKSATFSENSLLVYRKQDIPKMSDTVLQPEQILSEKFRRIRFSLNVGSSSSWLQHKTNTINNPMWLGEHLGGDINLFFKESRWSFSFGATAHQIQPISNYKQSKEVDKNLSKLEYDFAQINTDVLLNELNTGMFNSAYYQFSAPFKINFQYKRWIPFIGGEYNYTHYTYKIPQSYKLYLAQTSNMTLNFNDIALIAGTKYSISKKIGLSIEASQGFLKKHNFFENQIAPTLGINEYYFTSLSMYFSINYTF